jgi:SpoVK/Ycf46/Vps4 family AAA+-type ATPase
MVSPSKLAHDLTETSRTFSLKDPQVRSLILSLGTRTLALVGSMVFSYFLMRYVLKHLDPTHEEKKRQKELAEIISQKMNLPKSIVNNFNEYEMCLLTDLINPIDIKVTWQDIGGLDEIIDNVRQTVIYPLEHPELFNQSKLLTTPKGVLLYGPPGCGKTMLAKAIAREAGANFINLQVCVKKKK